MKLSIENKKEIISKFKNENFTAKELSIIYKVHYATIWKLLKNNNLKMKFNSRFKKIFSVNESYFNTIDSEDRAYFLGLMYADGYNNEKYNQIKISLQERDKHILEEFKKRLVFTGNLKIVNLNNKNKNWQNSVSLSIRNGKISKDLVRLGCYQAKSLTLKFPTKDQVPTILLKHFIRGYFDGDGHISKSGGVSIVSSVYFIENLSKILTDINIYHKILDCGNKNTKRLMITNKKNYIPFLDWIYKDSKIKLDRKYNKYISLNRTNFVNQYV